LSHGNIQSTDQGDKFQLSSLRHCSQTYGQNSDWLLDSDVDEFFIPTRAFTGTRTQAESRIYDCPVRPLAKLLDNWLYKTADAIIVSRVTFKNQGVIELPEDASVLKSQTLREFNHPLQWDKLSYTKVCPYSFCCGQGELTLLFQYCA
jgi:hypothetical protein